MATFVPMCEDGCFFVRKMACQMELHPIAPSRLQEPADPMDQPTEGTAISK